METVVRRCPFLSRVPQAFLQKAGKSLLFYAQNCPKMMEFGAKPAPRALSTSAGHCQQIKETPPASEKDKTAQAEVQQAPDGTQRPLDGTQLPAGHPSPVPSQGTASKCPFLAAQMSQTGSSVFRKASLELQEDVQEMHAVRKGVECDQLVWVLLSFCKHPAVLAAAAALGPWVFPASDGKRRMSLCRKCHRAPKPWATS